jgi:Fe-S cluster assembly protein SufD
MIQLADLPTRRVEAWKYSDLRAAVDESVQFSLRHDRDAPEVRDAAARGGIIGQLAAQMGRVETVAVENGAHLLRVDRPAYSNLQPSMIMAQVGEGATFTRVVIQASNTGLILDGAHVRVAAGGIFRQLVLAEGAKLARVETHVDVEGEGAHVELNGIYMAGPGRHADLTSTITHKVGGGQTRQLIKGVVRKGGRGVFQGKIVVAHGAQKTDARQYHHGLLLEDGAEIFAKPELMIHADDVQCAHGNTAGGLDEGALFYLRSRGVPEERARSLLIEAFLTEVVQEDLPSDIRDELIARVGAWLGGAA